jgi:APA family basic amino acid/polyamine antiporter
MTELKRDLTPVGLTLIVIGTLIGSGIFVTPSQIASHLNSPHIILLAWIVGGVVAIAGAFSFAELGSMYRDAGGVYLYLKDAYSPLFGFLFGWCSFTVIMTGIVAALAIACSDYVSFLFHLSPVAKSLTAILIVIILTIINIFRVKVAEIFTGFFTGVKLISITFVILIGLFWGSGDIFKQSVATNANPATSFYGLLSAFSLAMIGIMWSYMGWQHVTYLAGEAKNPQKDMPRAMVIGVMTVVVVYMLTNLSYMRLLPIDRIIQSDRIAADSISTVFPFGGTAIAVIIIFAIFATTFIYILTTPRIYFAMARDGLFFKAMAKVHPRHRTPVNAIIIQSLWAILLILIWGNFESVVTYVVFVGWINTILSAFTVIVFRIKRPEAPRPYKAWGYPVTTIVFCLTLLFFVINILIQKPVESTAGVVLLVAGLPVYHYFNRKKKNAGIQLSSIVLESESMK